MSSRALREAVIALLGAMALGSCLAIAYGARPAEVWQVLAAGTWGSGYGIGQVLYKTTALVFTGLSVAVAFRAGLFNVGAEGQMLLGALAAGLVGSRAGALGPLAVPAVMLAAAAAGAAWGALPGLLRATRGAHEVITTIMLNFVAQAVALTIGAAAFAKESLHTAPIADAARLTRLDRLVPALHGSAASTAIFVALASALGIWWWLFRSRPGLRLRVVGEAPLVAASTGVAVGRTTVAAMALAGALAGLASTGFVQGYKGYYEDGCASGAGFVGIAVALLGRSHPAGIVLAALLFGTLSQGGLAINALVAKELVDILLAVVILSLAALSPEARRAFRRGA